MNFIDGGVCAPKGFKASGVHCGVRYKDESKKDLMLIVSDEMCSAAAVYTQNKVKGAPIAVTKRHLADKKARAIVCNSGNANTCAANGEEIAEQTCRLAAEHTGVDAGDVIVCSTGVIGENMSIEPFERGMGPAAAKLSYRGGTEAAQAMMTTDTFPKEAAVRFTLDGKECIIGAAAKGSGMIHPNMATMLSFITTDAAVSGEMLQKALSADIRDSYNQLSVDGDTSTNDTVAIMANGMANNTEITAEGELFDTFCAALHQVTVKLVKMLASDGEGAGKMIECTVEGTADKETARIISKEVISSNLLKCAIFGQDANWGRVLCAIGYAPAEFSADNIDVEIQSENGKMQVCKGSAYYPFSEEGAAEILAAKEIRILINMNQGGESACAWGCDLTYDYVKINGDYRS